MAGVLNVNFGEGTVFVLGAGFTKAFIPEAPLLVDDYEVDRLIEKYNSFKEARELLEMEVQLTQSEGYRKGWINLERLMTRVVSGMPYDFRSGANHSFHPLLNDLKCAFASKLKSARQSIQGIPGELWLFAQYCVNRKISCITFNYDDLLDEALDFAGDRTRDHGWSPDWGYGFPCQSSQSIVAQQGGGYSETTTMKLIKLHGSINWRVSLGTLRPYGPHSIKHHEAWYDTSNRQKAPDEYLNRLLDPDPLIVPPVLTKIEIREHPIMQVTWSLALDALAKAKHVVFIGYSMPITDLAAGFLFREGLNHLDQQNITVVDFDSSADQSQKSSQMLRSYNKVLPRLDHNQIHFCGASSWIKNTLTTWLFDSKGKPVAFLANDHVISKSGHYVGNVRGYLNRKDVWHGRYKGDVISGNRFLRDREIQNEDRGGSNPPPLPSVPTVPMSIDPIPLPQGYDDIDWADEATVYGQPAGWGSSK